MEQRLKQRLVGAIVLVSLAVIFIPIILEGPGDDWAPRNHGVPEPPRMDYGVDMDLALPQEEQAEREEADDASLQPETVAAPMTAAPVPQPPEPVTRPEPERKPEPVATTPATPVKPPPAPVVAPAARSAPHALPPAGWYIQVGSFSQRLNAEGLRDRLQAAGHATQLQTINIGKAQVYRVLVGPAKTRSLAERQNSQLEKQQKLKGIVIEYPG